MYSINTYMYSIQIYSIHTHVLYLFGRICQKHCAIGVAAAHFSAPTLQGREERAYDIHIYYSIEYTRY